jgi:hypothetical protein
LAANPDAQADVDALVSSAEKTARAEGETAGKTTGVEQMKTAFTAALPILSSDSYPDTVKERVTAKAMAGDVEGLADFVAIHDMNLEKAAEVKSQEEKDAETLAQANQDAGLSPDGMVNNPEQLTAAAAQHKAEYGTDVAGGTN